ncbi:DNA polymerase III subunit delta' [Desulfosoma caldarium]|uniref:DNA polymerase III delta prime subunit n=1 Tax=Desulfosoma caldarium TaxID=610254 RepID=A0A3N1VKH5_9BACT|nr:DNA polymerase III subunit delta' [Desulfosoma caldarium]ROR03313.1 DNA polymerase III delta prime subunit [Desulfosoma caldarium]
MFSPEGLTAQPQAQRMLLRMMHEGRLPHAVLLTGIPGIGKKALALECAKAVNCLSPRTKESVMHGGASAMACGQCLSCTKIARGVHPDVLLIAKDGASIKLGQIRDLKERCRVHPYEGKRRVMILEDCQDLTEEASNALLKILEEPPASNLFLLLAPEPYSLMPTIVSRCCHLRCRPLDPQNVAAVLQNQLSLNPQAAARLAQLSFGSLDRARTWAQEHLLERMETVMDRLDKLLRCSMIEFFQEVAQWAKETENLEQDLECIKFAVREILWNTVASSAKGPGAAGAPKHRTPWNQLPVANLLHVLEVLETAAQHLRAHAAKQLLLEAVCLKIKDVIYGQGGKGYRYPFPRGRKNLLF